jgi:apolipoprotein N-acyltransferase
MSDGPARGGDPIARIALIQGSIDTQMQHDEGMAECMYRHYCDLSRQALAEAAAEGLRVDLMVWPESMFPESWVTSDPGATAPPE